MNYKFQTIEDKQPWEDFALNQSGKSTSPTSFIQSWNWGEFLKKINQKVYYIGVYEEENSSQKLIGIMLGTLIEAKRGKYIHFRHGPVINWGNSQLVTEVTNYLKNLAKSEGAWFIRISPLITDEQLAQAGILNSQSHPSQMHDVDAEETWVLDLDKSEEELLAGMRKNTRYSIRKAEKDGVEIIKTQDSQYLQEFWDIMMDTVQRQQWTFFSFDYIKNEFETFVKDNQAMLFLAKYQSKFIAASMFVFYNDQSAYHHSGALTEFRKVPASYLIQWEAIKEAKSRGLAKHNFWGLPLDENGELEMNDPWTGVGLFKVGFGGRPERWTHARDIPVNWKYWFTHYFEKFENFKRTISKSSN